MRILKTYEYFFQFNECLIFEKYRITVDIILYYFIYASFAVSDIYIIYYTIFETNLFNFYKSYILHTIYKYIFTDDESRLWYIFVVVFFFKLVFLYFRVVQRRNWMFFFISVNAHIPLLARLLRFYHKNYCDFIHFLLFFFLWFSH